MRMDYTRPPTYDGLHPQELLHLVADLDQQTHLAWRESAALRQSWRAQTLSAPTPMALPPPPVELQDRRVEFIASGSDLALLEAGHQSGAPLLVLDLDDTFSPTWVNLLSAYRWLRAYEPGGPVLMLRPRPYHQPDPRVLVDGRPVSGALLDVATFLWHRRERPGGLYLYLPKVESPAEARVWHAALQALAERLGIEPGRLRVTVQVEAVTAALWVDGIIQALSPYIIGLNAGRWDYLFNCIKRLGTVPEHLLPNREHLSMGTPFLRAYQRRLVAAAKRWGIQAIGGTAGLIPAGPFDPALAKVAADKRAEAELGFQGAWAVHPDLVETVRAAFPEPGGAAAPQDVPDAALLDLTAAIGPLTEGGARRNIAAALSYLAAWLSGQGAVIRDGAVEDTATAEVSRAQLWQWIRHQAPLAGGGRLTPERYGALAEEVMLTLPAHPKLDLARELLDRLVLTPEIPEFFPVIAQEYLEG